MQIKMKKLGIQLGVILIATALFAGLLQISSWQSENLKAALSTTELNDVWGQAYSPNVGWINFYCDGAGNTQPSGFSGGVTTMSDSCGSVSYGVKYDAVDGKFSGVAYSTNYGWLDMNGLSMTAPAAGGTGEVTGFTDGSGIGGTIYHFGKTYFEENEPNSYNPGVEYYNSTGKHYFCGFAYSKEVGYISFCNPDTEGSPVDGYDWNSYAVYMGNDDEVPPYGPEPPPTPTPPPHGTFVGRVLAADDEYDYTLTFFDDDGDVASIEIKVKNSNNNWKTYTSNDSDTIEITSHDFHKVGYYGLEVVKVCDYDNNCLENESYPNFFQVVANVPDWLATNSTLSSTSDSKISDGTQKHKVVATLFDEYHNLVIPVAGIKDVVIDTADFNFTDTTELTQIGTSTGKSTIFTPTTMSAGGTEGNEYTVEIASYAPTSAGYSPIESDGFDLKFTGLDYEVIALGTPLYDDVGETNGVLTQSVTLPVEFKFSPTLTAAPESTSDTVANSISYFDIDFQNNSSSKSVSELKLGLSFEPDEPEIHWIDAETNHATITNISLNSNLNDIFDFIAEIAHDGSDDLPVQAFPELTETVTYEEFETEVGTNLGYKVNGKTVTHKSGVLTDEGVVYKAYLDIIGLARSTGGITSNQTDNDLNQSLGDFARAEFKSGINRNIASIRNEGTVCINNAYNITNLDNFISDNSDCVHKDGDVIYLKSSNESTITLNLSGNLPDKAVTLIVEGGNLSIKSNLEYSGSTEASFGVIVLENDSGDGGDVLVYPDVKNISAVVYAEGSLFSTNTTGGYQMSDFSFPDRSTTLQNQLYWQGLIATLNTIGGSVRHPFDCPTGITPCTEQDTARIYDLNYFRTFHKDLLDASNYRASGLLSSDLQSYNAAFVVKYDSRIQRNPPPLFEFATGWSGGEIGY